MATQKELETAIAGGGIEVLRKALASGMEVRAQLPSGRTPLQWAAEHGQAAAIKVLLEHGAPINQRGTWRDATPLQAAVFNGHPMAAGNLLEQGANPNPQDYNGDTPLLWAIRLSHGAPSEMMVGRLLTSGADPNMANADGITPLMEAMHQASPKLVRLLIKAGANAGARDGRGRDAAAHMPVKLDPPAAAELARALHSRASAAP